MVTVLQDDRTILRRSDVWKAENETMPFGKELEVAMPQEPLDRHGAAVGGTSEEGPSMDGPHKAIGRQKD